MERKTLAVLFGGNSAEYDVSLKSACAVIGSIDRAEYEVIQLGITRDGRWLKYDGGLRQIQNNTWWLHTSCTPAVISPDRNTHGILVLQGGRAEELPLDAAFPVLHGKNGEDGTVQGLLELAGIPCVGCGLLSSALCMDKDIAHRLVGQAGIKTPACVVLCAPVPAEELLKKTAHLQCPLFVKPADSGSSFGITKVTSGSMLPGAVDTAFKYGSKVMVEEAVEGFEVGCAVLGTDSLTLGEVDEIELSHGFFDYTEKYTLKSSKIHMPARIDPAAAQRVKKTAARIYKVLNCSGFARVDLFLTPGGELVFNEVNTIPGFTAHSRYPNMLKGAGISFEQLVGRLIGAAMQP